MEPDTQPLNRYRPLIVILGILLLGSMAIALARSETFFHPFMNAFMGLFFLVFSMFKFFDLEGFANGFQKYDLIAKTKRSYALQYPFLELILGLLYLSESAPIATNIATLLLMSISAAGVITSMAKGYKFQCACLGTTLNVPLSTVTIIENVGMGLMALVMLLTL